MKKILLSIFSVCLVAMSLQAQSAKDLLKQAAESMKSADDQFKLRLLNPESPLDNPMAAVQAFETFAQALQVSEKKGDIKKAIAGLSDVESHLSNLGAGLYQSEDYAGSFANFDASIKASNLLKENGQASRLDEDGLLAEQELFAGITAFYSNNFEGAKPYYQKLYENGTEEAVVYEGLYQMTLEEDPAAAEAILAAGREKFPDNASLMFTEINQYLTEGRLDE